ncbi:hypothetical protein C8Q79DRAFT_966845 [Trametes meyenii]|nr:hypothetical protein C8Q79DRAFT_966845 [Trametes meyenii]
MSPLRPVRLLAVPPPSVMVQLAMDPTNYPYYTATSTGPDVPTSHHQIRHHHHHHENQGYTRSPESSPTSHAYPYQHPPLPPVVPGGYNHYSTQQQQQQQQGSTYPSHSTPSPSMGGTLPPLGQEYSRSATQADRYNVGHQAAFDVPSIGPTLHDLPFTASRSAPTGQVSRGSGGWGSGHSTSRTPPLYDRQGMSSSATYPPSRHGAHHPSLSHSTQLIQTPAQTAQTYHNFSGSSSPGGSGGPVVASIPPASGVVVPQERYYCEKCDKSFGRAHDKKRHYESAHLQTHHECRFCHKCFSRNDSLKRHQDNGCEKDPSFSA